MKESRRAVVARTVFAVLVSFGIAGVQAAPPGPAFGVSTPMVKLSDGYLRAPGGNAMATDGTNFYVVHTAISEYEGAEIVNLLRSRDGGKTWGAAHPVSTPATYGFNGTAAVTANESRVHVIWEELDSDAWDGPFAIYYAWANVSDLNEPWSMAFGSTQTKINGQVPAYGSWARASITNTGAGGIVHVVFEGIDRRLYHTWANESSGGEFSAPVMFGNPPAEWGDIESELDPDGNLHVGYPIQRITTDSATGQVVTEEYGVEYTMLAAGSTSWTEPVIVEPLTEQGDGFTTTAVFDSSNIYIAKHNYNDIKVFRSANGGVSWSETVLFSAPDESIRPTRHLSLAVNANKDLVLANGYHSYEFNGTYWEWIREDTMVFRGKDGGKRWANVSIVENVTSPSVQFDADGNAGIAFKGTNDLNYTIQFTKEQ